MRRNYQLEMLDPCSAEVHLFVIKVTVILVIIDFSAAVVLYEKLKVIC